MTHTVLSNTSMYSVSHLVVGPEARLTGIGSSRPRSTGRSPHSCVGGGQAEGVAIGGETNQQLFSWGTVALPVVHSIILHVRRASVL